MTDPTSIVSPGGVGFDINCGVRLLRTNLTEADVAPVKEQLAQALFDHIPVGVGSKGIIPTDSRNLEAALVRGVLRSIAPTLHLHDTALHLTHTHTSSPTHHPHRTRMR